MEEKINKLLKLTKNELLKKCNELEIKECKKCNKKKLVELIIKTRNIENKQIDYIKPIIKWVDGKTQIIDKIIENFPKKIKNYFELFLGGGSVLFAFLQNIEENKITIDGVINAYDINETLIHVYKNIQQTPVEVFEEIEKIIKIYNSITGNTVDRKAITEDNAKTSQESYYFWIRKKYNNLQQNEKNNIIGTAYFIFLNKTCFRGVYREGPRGFNVPFGNYKNPEIINKEHLLKVSKLIQNVNFYVSSFENIIININKNDFTYLDPPYFPINEKSFVSYNYKGFTLEKHNLLFEHCKKIKFLMSNSNIDFVKNNFNNQSYNITKILCKRSINSKNPESKINEILIKNY